MEVSTDSTVQTTNMYNYMNKSLLVNPSLFIISGIVLVIFVILFSSLGGGGSSSASSSSYSNVSSSSSMTDGTSDGIGLVSIFFIGLVLLTVFIAGIHYFYGTTAFASLKNVFNPVPIIDLKMDERHYLDGTDASANATATATSLAKDIDNSVPTSFNKDQVFNIPGNYFGYAESKSICAAYGARLAKYDEVEKAYNAGGEWCNYGWTEGQMALFPTQKKTYDKLQKIEGHEHDCGRPGVNGGYNNDTSQQLGANCYGKKPKGKITPFSYPKVKPRRVPEYDVSPFNYTSWSGI